ncbi:MAG: hypothetical protein ACJA1C_001051 [Crocinitomicaceae bacterium]|jgi:hypothetical protein
MKSKRILLIAITTVALSSCGTYNNKLRFTKVKKSPKKEIVSSAESKANNDLPLEKFTQEETSFENAELIPQVINSASETEDFSAFSDSDVTEPTLDEISSTEKPEVIEETKIEGEDKESRMAEIKYSRNRAWLNTAGALLTLGSGIGLTILFFFSWIGGATLIGGVVGAYIFYYFLCKHLYQAAIDSRILKYKTPEGADASNELQGWNLAHIIIASVFGFFIPLIVLGVKMNRVKKQYKPQK